MRTKIIIIGIVLIIVAIIIYYYYKNKNKKPVPIIKSKIDTDAYAIKAQPTFNPFNVIPFTSLTQSNNFSEVLKNQEAQIAEKGYIG